MLATEFVIQNCMGVKIVNSVISRRTLAKHHVADNKCIMSAGDTKQSNVNIYLGSLQ